MDQLHRNFDQVVAAYDQATIWRDLAGDAIEDVAIVLQDAPTNMGIPPPPPASPEETIARVHAVTSAYFRKWLTRNMP